MSGEKSPEVPGLSKQAQMPTQRSAHALKAVESHTQQTAYLNINIHACTVYILHGY